MDVENEDAWCEARRGELRHHGWSESEREASSVYRERHKESLKRRPALKSPWSRML